MGISTKLITIKSFYTRGRGDHVTGAVAGSRTPPIFRRLMR
jgi:hypothetical protein